MSRAATAQRFKVNTLPSIFGDEHFADGLVKKDGAPAPYLQFAFAADAGRFVAGDFGDLEFFAGGADGQ